MIPFLPRILSLILLQVLCPLLFVHGQTNEPAGSPSVPVSDVALAWPPILDTQNTTAQSLDGRTIERFIHGPRDSWGYPVATGGEWSYPVAKETGPAQQNHNSFYVVAPKVPRENAPLCVVLHSANRTAYDYLGFEMLNRKTEGNDDPATAMTNSPDDFYALYLNSTNAEWWGFGQTRENSAKHINAPTPVERRVLDTIEWVVDKYKIDRNRIYLCGVSMGGCGTLGIGLPNGNIFAAIRACVPAGTAYASYRMGGFGPSPDVTASDAERAAWILRASGVGLPDPPVMVDFSSEVDGWSMTQPALVQAAHAGHLALVLGWGPFGHATFGSLIAKFPICQVALAYPWLEIRKNEAYPVFTNATCDQRVPWLNAPVSVDNSGQSNAYFRWKSEQDTPTRFAMQLWIEHPTITAPPAPKPPAMPPPLPSMPEKATADVTLRRLQQFKVQPGGSYTWEVSRDGQTIASGKITPDAANLLTIPNVALTTAPSELLLRAQP